MNDSAMVLSVAMAAALFGLALLGASARALISGHALRGVVLLLVGGTLAVAGLVGAPVGGVLSNWEPLPGDQRVGTITVRVDGSGQGIATLSRPGQPLGEPYVVVGASWYLQARTLTWAPAAQRLGLVPRYRLEKIASIREGGRDPIGSSYSRLPQPQERGPVFGWLGRLGERLPPVAAVTDVTVTGPALEGGSFELLLSEDRLSAQPAE